MATPNRLSDIDETQAQIVLEGQQDSAISDMRNESEKCAVVLPTTTAQKKGGSLPYINLFDKACGTCLDDDIDITVERCEVSLKRVESSKSSIILSDEELSALREAQEMLWGGGKSGFKERKEAAKAEEQERKKRGLDFRQKVAETRMRARADKDNAYGVLCNDDDGDDAADGGGYRGPRRGNKMLNSLYALPAEEFEFAFDVADDRKEPSPAAAPAVKPRTHDSLYVRQLQMLDQINEHKCPDATDFSYVRKPDITPYLKERTRPKISLSNLLFSRRFHLYKHRFNNCQRCRTLMHPSLPQPKDDDVEAEDETAGGTEMRRSRPDGYRFVIAADTQFGILMDGYAMENPNWSTEIEISRRAVKAINAMKGPERPLFVCVCGDLVDTESSFHRALASWKKVMTGWERHLVFDQQVKDFKQVWSRLDEDIPLVCLCGNHDVGNRPTAKTIETWTSEFGDDYLAFWTNGAYNISMNNCTFSDPTGAPELYKEQLEWLEKRLAYARKKGASHIFVHSHFPWFLVHENETDEETAGASAAPEGWGPNGTNFPDNYFTIPLEYRLTAMSLFRTYGVTACFSGHFHQNVVAKSSWGMDMIVTGPLSMLLRSSSSKQFGPEPHNIGFRVVDVGAQEGKFKHEFVPLEEPESLVQLEQ